MEYEAEDWVFNVGYIGRCRYNIRERLQVYLLSFLSVGGV